MRKHFMKLATVGLFTASCFLTFFADSKGNIYFIRKAQAQSDLYFPAYVICPAGGAVIVCYAGAQYCMPGTCHHD
jgi:hypothetical protein